MNAEQLAAQLEALTLQVADIRTGVIKIGTETDGLIVAVQNLETQLANATGIPETVTNALTALQTQLGNLTNAVTEVDAKVPDAVAPAPETPQP